MRVPNAVVSSVLMLITIGCGGGSSSDDSDSNEPQEYSVGGVVQSLNGSLNLLIKKNSQNWESKLLSSETGDDINFSFEGYIAGTEYAVEVETQPQNQLCEVENSSGKISNTNVNNIIVSCTNTTQVETGILIDSAVSNVNYKTETMEGITNENGEFNYILGENVTFSIGDIELGTIPAEPVITPLNLASTLDITDNSVVNITRLLQSLDQDGNPETGIKINDLAKESANSFIDFSQPIDDFAFSAEVLSLLVNGGQDEVVLELKDLQESIRHLEQTISEITLADTISFPGTWRLTESYDICGYSPKVHYSTVTLGYEDGTYTYNQNFSKDIGLEGDGPNWPICTVKNNNESDENDTFQADERLTASQIESLLASSEIRRVIINSPDQFTVIMTFSTGLDDEIKVDVTQLWQRQ